MKLKKHLEALCACMKVLDIMATCLRLSDLISVPQFLDTVCNILFSGLLNCRAIWQNQSHGVGDFVLQYIPLITKKKL